MNISIVILPLYGVDMPPLGAAYIAAQLIAQGGHCVSMFCFNSALFQQDKSKQYLWGWGASDEWASLEKISKHFDVNELMETWVSNILATNPRMVGFSVNSHSRILSDMLAQRLKAKNDSLTIVFGGPGCLELNDMRALNTRVDVYVRGEGEEAVTAIANAVAAGVSVRDFNMEGTIVNTGHHFKDNGWRKSPLNIHSIAIPALHLFNLNNYTNKDEIPIIFSRGCNYNCKFCTDKPMWGNYRMRDAGDIVKEMKQHASLFGRTRFKCNDLMVNGDLKALESLTTRLVKENLGYQWGSMARARAEMTQGLFDQMRLAGCEYLTFGIESGSAKVLLNMQKPDKKSIAATLEKTHRAGIKVNTLWMVGYPYETWRDIFETMLFLFQQRNNIDEFVAVSSCYIPSQSLLGRQQDSLGIKYNEKGDWYIGIRNTPMIRHMRKEMLLGCARLLGLYKTGI